MPVAIWARSNCLPMLKTIIDRVHNKVGETMNIDVHRQPKKLVTAALHY